MKKTFISIIVMFLVFSCGAADSYKEEAKRKNGPLILEFYNDSDYDIEQIYISDSKKDRGYDYEADDGIVKVLNGAVLENNKSMIFCDFKSDTVKNYYITYVRQKGSGDTKLYITSKEEIPMGPQSGLIHISILPFSYIIEVSSSYDMLDKCREEEGD